MKEPIGIIRASSWPSLFDCALRWKYQNIDRLRSPSSGAAHLGTAIHAGTAVFDQAKLDGEPISADDAAGVTIDTLNNPEDDIAWDDKLDASGAAKIGVALTARYCAEIAPQREYSAVELQCHALDIETQYGVVRVTGTTDRVRVLADGREGISDLKSGARAVGADGRAVTKGHHMQVGIYQIMAEQETGNPLEAPAEIIGLQTSGKGLFGTGEFGDVKTPLLGTDDQPGLIEIAASMLKSGIFPPNPKSMLCSRKYCPAYDICKYHD
jgi:hypothetical protein